MALSIPNRFVTGQTIEAGKFNTNFDAITTWATTADADLATAVSTNATQTTNIANLGKGAFLATAIIDQVLSAGATAVVFADNTVATCFDTSAWFDNTTYKYTPLVAGAYQFNINICMTDASFTAGETVTVAIHSGVNVWSSVMSLRGGYNNSGCVSIVLKANGSTDAFYVVATASAAATIDYAQFSGFCVKPD